MNTWLRGGVACGVVAVSMACGAAEECGEALTFELEPPVSQEGSYALRVSDTQGEHVCNFVVPPESGEATDCSPDLTLYATDDQTSWGKVGLISSPESVTFELERDGTVVYSGPIIPNYRAIDEESQCREATRKVKWQ